MTTPKPFDPADFHKRSAEFRDLATVVVSVLAVVLIVRHAVVPLAVAARRGGGDPVALLTTIGEQAVLAGPAVFYACALWAARQTFARLARDAAIGPAVVGGVGAIGRDLGWGAVTAAVIAPNLWNWIHGRHDWFAYDISIASVVIALVGAALVLLSRLLARAAAQEAELAEII